MRTLGVFITFILLMGLTQAASAEGGFGGGRADTNGDAQSDGGGAVGTVSFDDSRIRSGSSGGGGNNDCGYVVGSHDDLHTLFGYLIQFNPTAVPFPETTDDTTVPEWVLMACAIQGGFEEIRWIFQFGEPPHSQTMLDSVSDRITVELPTTQVNPPNTTYQLVGVETWLWIDPAARTPISNTFCIVDFANDRNYACATLSASFANVVFTIDNGNGGTDTVNCPSGGTPYDTSLSEASQANQPRCGYVFEYDGELTVSATATWDLNWSCIYDADRNGSLDSSCGGGFLGSLDRAEPDQTLEVRQAQAIITGG